MIGTSIYIKFLVVFSFLSVCEGKLRSLYFLYRGGNPVLLSNV